MINAIVDNKIRINEKEISGEISDTIKNSLTFRNPEREQARKEELWGWKEMDEFIYFWERYNGQIVIPRGFAWSLTKLLKRKGEEIKWNDKRVDRFVDYFWEPVPRLELRDYQESAVERILEVEQGIYQAPTGVGKTIAVIEAIRRSGCKALIIVDRKHLLEQWRDRVQEHLSGYDPGFLGDEEVDLHHITIAMQQTLWSRRKVLKDLGFFDAWGFVCLDECHHASAETYKYIVEKFSSRYRIGVSATPDKNQKNPIAQCVLGEVFHITTNHEVKDIILNPKIETIETDFRFTYQPTFRVSAKQICVVPGCRKRGGHRHQNNYQDLLKELANDRDRNNLIVDALLLNRDNTNLIISRSLAHLDNIRQLAVDRGFPEDIIFPFTGKQTGKKRKEIMDRAGEGGVTLLSTVADEALDIPRLDRLYIVWPTRNPDLLVQQIGRGRRKIDGKKDLIVYDFVDRYVGLLRDQAKDRQEKVYSKIQ